MCVRLGVRLCASVHYLFECAQATASAARVTAAHAACTHLGGLKRALNTEDVATMVAACTPALSSLAVAEDMCLNVHYAADSEFFCVFNRDACCDGGALEAVFAVLSAHSRVLSATMAVTALQALSFLLRDAIRRATALVLSADGLDATVYVVMERYALDFDVQLNACELMWRLLSGMGPGTALNVIVNGRAAALLAEAKRLHPKLLVGVGSVVLYADKALAMLARRKQELKT